MRSILVIQGWLPTALLSMRICSAGGETFAANTGHVAAFWLQASSCRRSRTARFPFSTMWRFPLVTTLPPYPVTSLAL
jgi:hypothetical protein